MTRQRRKKAPAAGAVPGAGDQGNVQGGGGYVGSSEEDDEENEEGKKEIDYRAILARVSALYAVMCANMTCPLITYCYMWL